MSYICIYLYACVSVYKCVCAGGSVYLCVFLCTCMCMLIYSFNNCITFLKHPFIPLLIHIMLLFTFFHIFIFYNIGKR